MRGRRGLQAARRCGGRWLASLLVAVTAIDAPARALAQTSSVPPRAAGPQSATAVKLANVPDSIPFDPNPASSPTRAMAIDIRNALDAAGIDSREVDADFDETPTADTVTIEGNFPDGDLIVTGKLVNGRIELTKQFKPLLPSGEIGPTTTIAYSPTPAAAPVTTSAAGTEPAAAPAGAEPLPPELVRRVNLELEQHYRAEAAKIEGPFVVTGPGSTMGTTEEVPVSLPVVIGLLIVRDMYYAMLMAYARYLRKLKRLPTEEKKALVERLVAAAPKLKAAYDELTVEERRARMIERAHYETSYARYSAAAAYYERKGDFEQAAWYGKKADETPWGQYLQSRAKFVELLGENKEHQLLSLFRDTWAINDDGFLFDTLANPSLTITQRVEAFDQYLTENYQDLEEEAAEAKGIRSFDKLKRFFERKYDRVRDAAGLVTASTGVNLPGQSVAALGDIHESITSGNVAKQLATDVVIGVGLLIALTFFPVLGAVLNAGYAGFQVIREGKELGIAWIRVNEAQQTAGVTGQEQVFTEEDRRLAQTEKFVIAAGSGISEIKVGADAAPLLAMQARQRLAGLRSKSAASTPSGGLPSGAPAAAAAGEVDRASRTAIDLPAARADAASIAAAREQVAAELDGVDAQLATAAPADRVGLELRQQQLQTRLAQLDEEQRQLNALIARAENPDVDRAGVTMGDPNALREEFVDLTKRQQELELELANVSARAMRDPKLKREEEALEKQLETITAERAAVSARINQAEQDALNQLSPAEALQRAEKMNDEVIYPLQQRINSLTTRRNRTPDKAQQAELQKRIREAQQQLGVASRQFEALKRVAMRELDTAEAEVAREALDHEIELALKAGIPQQRVNELTAGYVKGKTDNLEQLGNMTDRLFEERLKKPILDLNNPADADAIAAAQQEATLIRGGVVSARTTGRLPDDLQEYLAEKGGLQYVDSLHDRYFRGGGELGRLDERYPIVQNEILDELKQYLVPPGTSLATGLRAARTADAAGQPNTSAGASSTATRNEIRDLQQQGATRALLGETALGRGMLGLPLSDQPGRTPAEEVAILERHIAANALRAGLLAPRAFGSGVSTSESTAARNEFYLIESNQQALIRTRNLLRAMEPPRVTTADVPFAPNVPDGPNFAVTGAPKPKRTDSGTTAPKAPPPLIIRITPANGASFNPLIINNANAGPFVQKTIAEGQEINVGGSSEQPKDPNGSGGPGLPPARLFARLGGLLAGPRMRANLAREFSPGRFENRSIAQQKDPATGSTSPPVVKVVMTSLGRSSGDAVQMTVINEGAEPVKLSGDSFVLEPIANVSQSTVERELARGAGRTTATLKAYCLEFLKQPPSVGMVFRLAPESVQKQFAATGRIFEASRRLRTAGALQPGADDPRSPDSYFDDVRQWAIWTREQGFDEKSYRRAFVEHSRKNVETAGHTWTRELEEAFVALGTGQWQAVQLVLREAAAR